MPKVSEMIKSKWLKASDCNGDVSATIDRIANEDVAGDGKPDGYKWTCYFRELEKGLVLNVTNIRALESAFGDDSDDWVGKRVVLFSMPVPYQGKIVQGVRLRADKNATSEGGVQEDNSL